MAHSNARASEVQYDLFLSFSGDDTRKNFTGSLHQGLEKAGIRVFRDEDEIKIGDQIGETILQAIDNSKFYIPIISQTNLERKWCLIELEHMMDNVSRLEGRQKIFPIFYKVEPGDVKHWTPQPKSPSSEVELRAFKEALAKVGQIKGWKVKEGQSQTEIVDKVVQKVLEVLGRQEVIWTEYSIELDDLTRPHEDCLNRADKGRRDTIGRERSPNRGRIRQFEGNVICKEREPSVGREREDDGKHMKYMMGEQTMRETSVGGERVDNRKHMKYMLEEQMRRGTSVGKEKEDDGKHMKYVLKEWLREGTSSSRHDKRDKHKKRKGG